MKEAELQRNLSGGVVMCTACARRCRLNDGQVGFCGVRANFGGRLFLVVYGKLSAIAVDPIEKKPLFHFNPGSSVLSMSTYGCSWACQFCQNFDISQRRLWEGFEVTPELIIELAESYGVQGLTYTYNEPSVFAEFAHDVGLLAKKKGLFNTFVTNGYLTDETVDYLSKFLDAATVDIKGNANKEFLRKYSMVPDPEPIFQSIKEMRDKGIHVEITDLVVPEIGDRLEDAEVMLKRIMDYLGPDVSIHFLRFHPDYKLSNLPPTPVKTLEKHAELARRMGFRYVYLGNVPGHKLENTYCPNCGNVVIRRYGFQILEVNLTEDNRCRFCGAKINIDGKVWPTWREDRFAYVPIHLFTKYTKVTKSDVEAIRGRLRQGE
ncbi:AmmeMemoRadiSam system radical SAM enzyme [Caldivirga maquilingensis]|uniref:Radical SAM domain protein n=1 Tax=Caldivirga maquilingensis (strain ATCC 700844 / DSM 13496 / JCM 10307 / IC-167) TaxID=397948 RepID=A8MC77_CALMQ|nr:AmmeMemoRadiSam system radical SAM enzyme [Caldivirga maquilingensis]ABW01383.1 Radical SAM domain protein [Caldivirga maquilingensis IC-167]